MSPRPRLLSGGGYRTSAPDYVVLGSGRRRAPSASPPASWPSALRARDASGHTPGTSALLIESDGWRVLLLGDIAHTQPELVHAWRFRMHVDSERPCGLAARGASRLSCHRGNPVLRLPFPRHGLGVVVRDTNEYSRRDVT